MFSFNSLGNNGHLGNQMFQYAFVKSMSIKHSRDFMIPPRYNFGSNYGVLSKLDDYFNLECNRGLSNYSTVHQRIHSFDEDLFNNPPKNPTNYEGYFQTEKYFKHIENDIREDFKFKKNIFRICSSYINQIFNYNKILSLHVRRGDYVYDNNFTSLGELYYKNALELFDKNIPVLVFSDDIEWCQSQKIFTDNRFTISKSKDPGIDMCLMSLCDYHIIANSSFSWWGSWLAKSKKTVAPKKWFSEHGILKDWEVKDLYLSDWIVL